MNCKQLACTCSVLSLLQMTKFTVTSFTVVTILPLLILAAVRLGFQSLKFGIGRYDDGLVGGCFVCRHLGVFPPPPQPSL